MWLTGLTTIALLVLCTGELKTELELHKLVSLDQTSHINTFKMQLWSESKFPIKLTGQGFVLSLLRFFKFFLYKFST